MPTKKVNRSAKDGEFVTAEEAEANPDTTVTETVKSEDKPKTVKSETAYFKNKVHSSLTVLFTKGQETLKSVRFTAYYDTWKGDTIRVGYLVSSDKDIIARCREDYTCIEISAAEYDVAINGDKENEPLRVAPIAAA